MRAALEDLLARHLARAPAPGRVTFVGAGPGDPELLTLAARRALGEADVVLHDRLVPAPILELARREALILETGKTGFGPAMPQAQIDARDLARHPLAASGRAPCTSPVRPGAASPWRAPCTHGYAGRLRAAGHIIADQYAMARRAGFDEVEIDGALAARQPEVQWRARADWRAHDH